MISPEVWKFSPPPFSFSHQFCESEKDLFQIIRNYYFNHYVSIILPNTMQIPQDLIDTFLEDSEYYKISKISASEFFDKNFIDLFVQKGQLTAINVHPLCDKNDSIAFTPDGHLILSLTRKSYQELGITGSFLTEYKSCKREFIIDLNMAMEKNQLESALNNVRDKLRAHSNLWFDIILTWEPNDTEVCPSSIALYFSKKGYSVKTCRLQYQHWHSYNVSVPVLEDVSDVSVFMEWLGAFSLKCNLYNDNYISTMKNFENSEIFGQVIFLSFTGFLTITRIKKIISRLKENIIQSYTPWIALFVQEFEDGFFKIEKNNLMQMDGNQNCTVILKKDKPSLLCSFYDCIK